MANIRGTSGFDSLSDLADSDDVISALGGDDFVQMVHGGSDKANGGKGRDVLSYVNHTLSLDIDVDAGTSRDSDGNVDTFKQFEEYQGGMADDTIDLGNTSSSAAGNRGNDTLIGGDQDNWFNGGSGDDLIQGGGGFDLVQYLHDGSPEADIFQGVKVDLAKGTAIDGWGDKDTLVDIESVEGTDFDDRISGSGSSNLLVGNEGDDVIDGGRTVDNIDVWDMLRGGAGDDRLSVIGGVAIGDEGDDVIRGLPEPDNVSDFEWSGTDYRESESGIVANLTNKARGGLAAGNTKKGFEVSDGLGGVDRLSKLKFIQDRPHYDVFHVNGAWKNTYGKWIEIQLTAGDDEVSFSGLNVARISYTAAGGGVRADLQKGTAEDARSKDDFIGNDSFSGHNQFRGSKFDDVILGKQSGDKRIRGHAGDDEIDGRGGNDVLEGEAGNDDLIGGKGKDKLTGGQGKDDLEGGGGRDKFVFTSIADSTKSSKGRDTINDFSRKQKDKMDLRAIDADVGSGRDDAFDFIGEDDFTGDAGALRYEHKKGSTFVYGDVDGDSRADFAIRLSEKLDLAEKDFLL